MKVRFYGKLAALFGDEREVQIDAPCCVSELRWHLASSQPQAASILQDKRVRACLGDLIVGDDHVVQESEVIELLAPVSGG